jgi:hypothetical protein
MNGQLKPSSRSSMRVRGVMQILDFAVPRGERMFDFAPILGGKLAFHFARQAFIEFGGDFAFIEIHSDKNDFLPPVAGFFRPFSV